MASTPPSSAPTRSEVKYDAYVSFSKDTRNNFTSHLLAALCRAKIETFTHDALIEKVYEIPSSVLRAIEESRVYIIIFSKGYASSAWCLDELVKIIDCKKRYSQIVIPVFYQVDPGDVRSQSAAFEDVFAKHEEVYKTRLDKVQRWRDALTEASILDGWFINDDRPEAHPVEEIVKHVLERLDDLYPSNDKNLIGVQSCIENIESLLRIGLRDVCIIGIWGMGGIGKTAIARAVFDRIFRQFEGYYFAENVWLESEKDGLIHLGKELLATILEDEHLNLRSAFTKQRFQRKKVLIVLDDVTSIEQIEKLIGDFKYLALGARVIITSRDRQVLKHCGVDDANIFEVQRLCDDDALQLFRRFAFGQNRSTADCMEVSIKVVTYAQGVPLALKVLRSFLFGKKKQDWEREINKLENCQVIRRSYDGLHDEEKNIFLAIAFFFNRWDKYLVEEILDASYFSSNIGISTLIDKALITIFHNTITMNGLLQGMGKRIVQEQSMKDPSKRNRLKILMMFILY